MFALAIGTRILAGFLLLAAPLPTGARVSDQHACASPEAALRRYVNAVNADDFGAQYALFAPVEHEGAKPAPIPLLPRESLSHLLASLRPAFPRGLELGTRPLRALHGVQPGMSAQEIGFLVPVRSPGQPAPPSGQYSGSYFAVLSTRQGWKVRAWATYWMYFERAYGAEAGQRFRGAYQKEEERLSRLAGCDPKLR